MPRARIGRREFFARAAGTGAGLAGASGAAAAAAEKAALPRADLALADLDALTGSVQGVIAGRGIGQPVFVRYTLRTRAPLERPADWLAHLSATARSWVGQALDRVLAAGSPAEGQVCLTLQFRGGATALVSLAPSPGGETGADVMVVGNHGVVYHDAGMGLVGDGARPPAADKNTEELRAAVERALRSGKPEAVQDGGRP